MSINLKTASILVLILALAVGCGGPLPPQDPFNLGEAKESMSRGNHWYERGCYREALAFYQSGLESARLSDDILLIIRAQNSLGAAALAEGDKNAAAAYLEQALNITSGHPGQPELDKVLGNLGSLAFQMNRQRDAEEFWLQAVKTAEEHGQSAAPYYCNLARLYLDMKRTEDFNSMAAKALAAAEINPDDRLTLADALNLAGHQARAAGDLAGAEDYLQRALTLDRSTENSSGLAQDTEALGLLMIDLGRYSEAAGYFDRAFFLWLAINNDRNADRVLALLQNLSRQYRHPQKMEPYQAARRNPAPHRLVNQCP